MGLWGILVRSIPIVDLEAIATKARAFTGLAAGSSHKFAEWRRRIAVRGELRLTPHADALRSRDLSAFAGALDDLQAVPH